MIKMKSLGDDTISYLFKLFKISVAKGKHTIVTSWIDSYNIGNETIDSQHKKLFDLINNLDGAVAPDLRKEAFRQLDHFTREHFSTEETLMSKNNYPQLRDHQTRHEELLKQLSLVAAQPLPEKHYLATFKRFMTKWLFEHIEKEDRKLSSYLQE